MGKASGQDSRGADGGRDTRSVGEPRRSVLDGSRSGEQLSENPKKNVNNNHVERGKDYAQRKTPLNTNVGTSEDGLAYSSDVQSGYKVNDLIHSTQENDQKLLGISDKSNLNFQRDLRDKIFV